MFLKTGYKKVKAYIVKIYNEQEQLILKEISYAINVQNLSKGLYYCEIETNNGITTKKLIIN